MKRKAGGRQKQKADENEVEVAVATTSPVLKLDRGPGPQGGNRKEAQGTRGSFRHYRYGCKRRQYTGNQIKVE